MTKLRHATGEHAAGPPALTSSMEDYIKAIYQLARTNSLVTTTALAQAMPVAPASATHMIKKLARLKLVRHSRYRGVSLTEPGNKIALEVLRHHRLIELFLNETLGIPWDQVHDEAHKLEHVLSENVEEHIAELLGNPTADPHGDPIPTKAGEITESPTKRLADLPPGDRATIQRVGNQDPKRLRYLSRLGLVPHTTIVVVRSRPKGGPLRVLAESGQEHDLDEAIAREIWVDTGRVAERTRSRRRSASRPSH